jgi:hypothetical protein
VEITAWQALKQTGMSFCGYDQICNMETHFCYRYLLNIIKGNAFLLL